MKKLSLLILSLCVAISFFGQGVPEEYNKLINKADSLYRLQDYKTAAFTYLDAINANGGKALVNDRYNAACAWALANYPDSAFNYLNVLAEKGKYSYFSNLVRDFDFISLHNDNRWEQLLEVVKQNKKEADKKRGKYCSNISEDDTVNEITAEIKSYQFNVEIDVKRKLINVEGDVEIDFKNGDSINLILWGKTIIKEIEYDGQPLVYIFDTISKSPIMYIPDGRMLTVKNPHKSTGIQTVSFKYECNMNNVSGWGRSFTDDWIEIGYYTAWFPLNDGSNFTSKLRITIDEPYKISGSGIVQQKENVWEMVQEWKTYDNIIVASKELKSRKLQYGDATVETVYTTFPEIDIDSVLVKFKDVLEFHQRIYGVLDNRNANYKFVICPTRGGGGYGRKNYISLKANSYNPKLGLGIAHELAHLWWNKTNATTWHNWIDEAFAEYSLLLYAKEKMGKTVFNAYQEAYRVNASYSCPIWGIDRATPEAYTALYEKGSILLYDLEQKVGIDQFLKFSKHILQSNVTTTQEFLSVAEKDFGANIHDWIEIRLKSENYE